MQCVPVDDLVCTICLPTVHTNFDPVQVLLHCIGRLGAKHLERVVSTLESAKHLGEC